MTTSTTMTIRVSSEIKEKLSRLAHGTRRSKSYLAAEAVSAYVERELEIIEGIQRGWPTSRLAASFRMTTPWPRSTPSSTRPKAGRRDAAGAVVARRAR